MTNLSHIQALPPITATQVATARAASCVRQIPGREDAEPLILVHGNIGSSVFLFPILQHLPRRFRPIALDLRGFGGSDPDPVDATRGVRDFSDDVLAVMDALGLGRAHLLGWSLGGSVVMQAAVDAPERLISMTVIAPISPFGLGGTVDAAGTLLAADAAGSGAGLVSRSLVQALADGDTSEDNRSGPRQLLRRAYVGPNWDGADEEELLASMLSTAIGPDNFPGDSATSENWPYFSPGTRGVMNAISPKYLNLSALPGIDPKPPLLWLRGDADMVISDSSMMDVAVRGERGSVAGYPGPRQAPPQPMIAQTRAVFEEYAAAGGPYREVVLPGVGHGPQLEDLPRVLEVLVPHLDGAVRP